MELEIGLVFKIDCINCERDSLYIVTGQNLHFFDKKVKIIKTHEFQRPTITMSDNPPSFLHLSPSHLSCYPEMLRSAQRQGATEPAAERGLGVMIMTVSKVQTLS